MPTRYNEIGLAGRPVGANDGDQQSAGVLSDPFLRQYVLELPLVASAAEQTLPLPAAFPAVCQSCHGFLRIKVASTAGVETITIGSLAGGPADLLASTATNALGITPTIQDIDLSGDQITYTLGDANVLSLEAELVLTVLASDT